MVKKILVWFLLVTMLIACSALCFGCGLGDDTTASETEPPVEKPAHLPDSYTQISGSALIFAPNSSPALMACVSDLFSRLNASGADVAVMESAVVPSERYIYICEVTDFESQYDFTLGLNDYCILTDDNGVVISAGGVNALKNAIAAFADGVFMGRYYYEYGTNICHFAAEPDNDKFAEILEAYHDTDGRLMTVAHRADHQNYPENSLEAIESCIAAGVDIVELDVRRTKDGKYVLMHDDTVNRTTNGSGSVSSMTLSEIQSLYLREGTGGGGAAVTDIRPPSFEEVLEVCKGKIIINLDKDANNASYFDEIYALLEKHDCVNIAQFKTSESPSVVRARFAKLEAQGKELPLYCLTAFLSRSVYRSQYIHL